MLRFRSECAILMMVGGDSMSSLGKRLKAYREKIGLSLHQVNDKTGITNSRLSRIERGQISCPPDDLKRLAEAYGLKTVPLFIEAGYLTEEDMIEYQFFFDGISKLDNEEQQYIQEQIDFLNRKKDT